MKKKLLASLLLGGLLSTAALGQSKYKLEQHVGFLPSGPYFKTRAKANVANNLDAYLVLKINGETSYQGRLEYKPLKLGVFRFGLAGKVDNSHKENALTLPSIVDECGYADFKVGPMVGFKKQFGETSLLAKLRYYPSSQEMDVRAVLNAEHVFADAYFSVEPLGFSNRMSANYKVDDDFFIGLEARTQSTDGNYSAQLGPRLTLLLKSD